jgi:very-short-patch-repair endonuclease
MSKHRPTFTQDEKTVIISRYEQGEGLVSLAREYGCRYQRIKEIITDANIKLHTETVNTPIERRLQDALMSMGISFRTQSRIVERYVVDIQILQAPIIIEADGIRHRLGNGLRDAKRDAAHQAAGYKVYRFSGNEINSDALACIQRVVQECDLVSDTEPIYDIRTTFSGRDHPRWREPLVIICSQCRKDFTSKKQRKYCSPACDYASRKGKSKSAEHRAKIGEANKRRQWTTESRAKIAASRVGRPTTKGRKLSDDTKLKISIALKNNNNAKRNTQIKIESDPA